MKRLFLLTLLVMCVVGCQKNIDTPESNLIEVGFSSNIPSITFDDEPLVQTRASYDEPKYLIQVCSDGEPYAYGVLKDITSQKILMEAGKTYTMEVAYFPNGHSMRFYRDVNNQFTDGFVYSVKTQIRFESSFGDMSTDSYYFLPDIKYYKENTTYTASSNSTNIKLDLDAWVFGLSFNVTNFTEGTINIKPGGSHVLPAITITPDKPEYEAVYSMYNQGDTFYKPDVLISYTNASGVETKIYEGQLPTALLKKTIVNINLKPASNETESSFSVNLEDITIIDGETLDLNQE